VVTFSSVPASTINNDDCDEAVYDFAVTSATPPVLGAYSATSVTAGQNTTVTPSAAPTGATRMAVGTNTNFTGLLSVSPSTGVVTATAAMQAGTYPVTVTAFNGGGSTTATFTLTVTNPACSQAFFGGTTDVAVGSYPISVAIGDFNGDGKQDFAVANQGSGTVSIRLGDWAASAARLTWRWGLVRPPWRSGISMGMANRTSLRRTVIPTRFPSASATGRAASVARLTWRWGRSRAPWRSGILTGTVNRTSRRRTMVPTRRPSASATLTRLMCAATGCT